MARTDLIWTKHVLRRIAERRISRSDVKNVFYNFDNSQKDENNTTRFIKRRGNQTLFVLAKQNERNEWVIISAWANPPVPGSLDEKKQKRYREYVKASPLRKIFLTVLSQLGL